MELAQFFQKLTARTLQVQDMKAFEDGDVLVLFKLECIFHPIFFYNNDSFVCSSSARGNFRRSSSF